MVAYLCVYSENNSVKIASSDCTKGVKALWFLNLDESRFLITKWFIFNISLNHSKKTVQICSSNNIRIVTSLCNEELGNGPERVSLQCFQLILPSKELLFFIRWSSSFPPSIFGKWWHGSLHHSQVFERVAALLLGFISRSEEFNLPFLGFDFVLVLLHFLLGCDVWVSNRLGYKKSKTKKMWGDW